MVNGKSDKKDYIKPRQTFHLSCGTICQSCHYAKVFHLFYPAYIRSIGGSKQQSSREDQRCSIITLQPMTKLIKELGVCNEKLRIYKKCHRRDPQRRRGLSEEAS